MRSLLANGCAGMNAIAGPQVNAPSRDAAMTFHYVKTT